jgi:hypothetical protein
LIHYAAAAHNVDSLALLLQHGANPQAKDSSGLTPFFHLVPQPTVRACLQLLVPGLTSS